LRVPETCPSACIAVVLTGGSNGTLREACRRRTGPLQFAAERGTIDDVIMPHATRKRVARALAMFADRHAEVPRQNYNNLPL
jgi:acetyl-CoA carboxylase carboxyltransferase component